MEEAKRKLNEHGQNHPLLDDEKLVSASLQHIVKKDDQHFRAWEHLHNYISGEPRRAWEITLKLVAAANSESLVHSATGPLEDLLYSRAEVFVDDVERLLAAGVPIRFIDDEWPSCEPKGTGDGGET